ncbi:MAG: low molecular weight phosphatase family protein [Clostridiales bacterium 38-18]|nr:MAG: low molecular weight phosphatase family protein [Clostridiales bacterium 38-18]
MKPIKLLFVCVHNAARSQMAEAFLNHYGEGKFIAESAGMEAGVLNPLAIEAMNEIGLDISKNSVDSVFEFFKSQKFYSYVITVCDETSGQKCPIFPGINKMIHWSFEDPSTFEGSYEERLEKTRLVRDKIKTHVLELLDILRNRHEISN